MTSFFTADLSTLALTVLAEAGGEPVAGQMAVAHVILNRVKDKRWPNDIATVCTQPKQFSCWNAGLIQPLLIEDPVFNKIVQLCLKVLVGTYADPTNGANHYVNLKLAQPSWYDPAKVTAIIGRHTFLRL